MEFTLWLAFVAATTALLLIPGPTVLLVLSYAIGHGRRVAVSTALGVALGGELQLRSGLPLDLVQLTLRRADFGRTAGLSWRASGPARARLTDAEPPAARPPEGLAVSGSSTEASSRRIGREPPQAGVPINPAAAGPSGGAAA